MHVCLSICLSVNMCLSIYLVSFHTISSSFIFHLICICFLLTYFLNLTHLYLCLTSYLSPFSCPIFLLSPSFLTFIFFSPSFILLFIFLYLFLLSPLPFPSFPFSSFLSLLPPMLNIPFSCISLYLDKTGTLTQNLMSVANTWFMGKKHDIKSFSAQNEEVLYNIEALHVIFYYNIL